MRNQRQRMVEMSPAGQHPAVAGQDLAECDHQNIQNNNQNKTLTFPLTYQTGISTFPPCSLGPLHTPGPAHAVFQCGH